MIALDLILVAGLVGGRAVIPAEEVLAISSNQLARGHEVSKAVLCVGLGIHRSGYVILDGNVFYGKGAVLGVVGEEGDVAVNLGVNVEGLAGAVRAGAPAAPRIAGLVLHDRFLKGIQLFGNRAAVLDTLKRRTSVGAIDLNMRRSVDSRLIPFGVNSHVLCGHSLAGEGICLSARRVGVPTAERERIGKRGRSCGSIAARIGNALLVIVRSGFYRNAVIDINDIIAVAGVVEFGVVILCL